MVKSIYDPSSDIRSLLILFHRSSLHVLFGNNSHFSFFIVHCSISISIPLNYPFHYAFKNHRASTPTQSVARLTKLVPVFLHAPQSDEHIPLCFLLPIVVAEASHGALVAAGDKTALPRPPLVSPRAAPSVSASLWQTLQGPAPETRGRKGPSSTSCRWGPRSLAAWPWPHSMNSRV